MRTLMSTGSAISHQPSRMAMAVPREPSSEETPRASAKLSAVRRASQPAVPAEETEVCACFAPASRVANVAVTA